MIPLLEIKTLSKTLGGRVLFDEADFIVAEGQRIGVIGRNGAGKTTLFRLILGQEKPDTGTVHYLDGLRLGWVEQHESFASGETVLGFLERTSGKAAWECGKLAARFQLKGLLLGQSCLALSGGFRMRVKLAAMLLRDPNLLLLDEPTNYLDLATLLLLEEFLRSFRGGYMVISHDRQFLKNTCSQTLEIENGHIRFSPTPLETYLAQKENELAWKLKTNKKIELERQRMQGFVNRFRGTPTKATQVLERVRRIDKLQTIEIEHSLPVPRMHLPYPPTTKGFAMRTTRLSIGYPAHTVAHNIDLDIQRGEHAVIVGDNGQGKTTLLKTIAGFLPPISGWYTWWPKASVGVYTQHVQDMLMPEETVEAYLRRQSPLDIKQDDVLRMAGDFLFRDDDLEKPTKVLSGGEKARLCLAGILLHRHSVLLLDEPTNHLDFETTEAFAAALREYPGTVVFISHDRTFVQIVSDRILEVRDGVVRQYPRTYEEYVQDMESRLEDDLGGSAFLPFSPPAADQPLAKKGRLGEVDAKEKARVRHTQWQEKNRERARLEKAMVQWDKKKSKLMAFFFDHPLDYDPEKRRQLEETNRELGHLEEQWYALQQTIQELK